MKQRILLVGSEGHDLLNRISTLDLGRLQAGAPTLGLILNPQGKIRCSYSVTRVSDDSVEILFEPPFLEILDQYTFAEKYQIQALDPLPESALDELDRIQQLKPKFGFEFNHDEMINPLEINLRSAIHDAKGCYPGQEVIEKIISLGSPPRRLVLVKSRGANDATPEFLDTPTLPQPLLDSSTLQNVGELTSYKNGFGLGIVKRTHIKTGTSFKLPQGQELEVVRSAE